MKPPPHVIRERRIVWNLMKHLAATGWVPQRVWDGYEYVLVSSAKKAMEVIFNLDDAVVYFVKEVGLPHHFVSLMLGNDLYIVHDWSFSDGDLGGFSATMDKFDPEVFA